MAKLSAKNRTELARVSKENQVPESEGRSITWERRIYTLMSDGVILEKYDVLFKQSDYEDKPQRHSYGWKVACKRVASNITPDMFRHAYSKEGYRILK